MTVWELIQQLADCQADAQVHFKVDIDADTISELADDGAELKNEPMQIEEVYDDGSDVDIRLFY